jgi:hypothetical protein
MPIDLADLNPELDAAERAFEAGGQRREAGLDVDDAGLVQLRKGCRSLAGADQLHDAGYYTLGIEAAFTSIEKVLLFWLIWERHRDASRPPQSHTTAIHRSVEMGLVDEAVGNRLVDLWEANRARTYYQDAIATETRAETLLELATTIHEQVVGLVGVRHECVCSSSS